MNVLLSIVASIGETDTSYIIIAFIAIVIFGILFKIIRKKQE